jgi:uncharacterized protein YecT (DUF1311 family)
MRWYLAIVAVIACASCASKPPQNLESLDWHPQLDQPIRQLEEVLAATQQQQPRNYTSANLAFALDAKLYFLFTRYIATAPEGKRSAELDEQRQWLEQRKRATADAYAEYQGGTFASFAGNTAFIEVTKRRIAEIEQRLGRAAMATVP